MAIEFEPYSGIPYQCKGRTHEGVDCWGLIYLFYKEQLGITLPTYDTLYQDSFDKRHIGQLIDAMRGDWVKVPDMAEGDVVLFRSAGYNFHVGLIMNRSRFMHVVNEVGVVIERLDSVLWNKRQQGFFRYG